MTESGQGGTPQPGTPWGPAPTSGHPGHPGDPGQQPEPEPYPDQYQYQHQDQSAYPYQPPYQDPYQYGRQPQQPPQWQEYPEQQQYQQYQEYQEYGQDQQDQGYGQYPPQLPPQLPSQSLSEDATQYIPPVPAAPAPAPAHAEAATQFIPPVPAAPGGGAGGGSRGVREDDAAGHTQTLPPIQEPVLRQPPPRARPPRGQGPVPPGPQPRTRSQARAGARPAPSPHPQRRRGAPPAEAARKVSPGAMAAVVVGLAVVGLGVGSLLGDGKPQNTDPGAAPSVPAGPGGPSAAGGEAPVDPARPQAVQLDKLLADSNDSRAAVIKAVDDIKACRELDRAADDLRDAARQREELVTRLQELKLDRLPDHVKLADALTRAWKSSASADTGYAAWAEDVEDDDRGCKDGRARNSGNAVAANRASGEATRAKESAAGLWNTIAAKYGLVQRDPAQL